MLLKLLGKTLALPLRVAALPLRIIEKTVDPDSGPGDALPGPGSMLINGARVIESSVEELGKK